MQIYLIYHTMNLNKKKIKFRQDYFILGYTDQMVFFLLSKPMIWEIDPLSTTCKIMSIPVYTRGKVRESRVQNPPCGVKMDRNPNPEPMGLSVDTRFNYFLILCDRFLHSFIY